MKRLICVLLQNVIIDMYVKQHIHVYLTYFNTNIYQARAYIRITYLSHVLVQKSSLKTRTETSPKQCDDFPRINKFVSSPKYKYHVHRKREVLLTCQSNVNKLTVPTNAKHCP